MMFQLSDFNNIYVLETNGFRIDGVESGYSREYGILSFTSDHGIYENCETYGNGDSGVYPGSGPDRHGLPDAHGHVYGIVIRNCNSHDNNIGSSGTAGNGTLFQNNKFHHNAIGIHHGLVRGRAPGPAAGRLEVDRQPGLLEQQEHLQRRPRRVLQAARGGSRPDGRVSRRSRCRSAPAC